MVTNLGNAVSGTIYNGATISLPRPTSGAQPHRPWCAECKRTVDSHGDLDQHGRHPRCTTVVKRRAAAAQRSQPTGPVVPTAPVKKAPVRRPANAAPRVSAYDRVVVHAGNIVARYEAGETLLQLAQSYAVGERTLRQIVVDCGGTLRKRGHQPTRFRRAS